MVCIDDIQVHVLRKITVNHHGYPEDHMLESTNTGNTHICDIYHQQTLDYSQPYFPQF